MRSQLKKYNIKLLLIYLVSFISLCLLIMIYINFDINNIFDKSYLIEQSIKLEFYINKNFIVFFSLYSLLFIILISIIPFTLPAIILTSIIYKPLLGAIISTICITIASTIFFIFFIRSNLISLFNLKKIEKNKIILKLKKNELLSIFLFRITGGGGLPLIAQNMILFYSKVNLKNFILGTLMGTFPGNLLISFLGIGLFEVIKGFLLS